MKISEILRELRALKKIHGDLEVNTILDDKAFEAFEVSIAYKTTCKSLSTNPVARTEQVVVIG